MSRQGLFRPARSCLTVSDEPVTSDRKDPRPRLAPGVRLHFDQKRAAWVLLAPERVIETEGPTVEILRRCDGTRTISAVVDELAAQFVADRAVIDADVRELLAELAEKRLLRME